MPSPFRILEILLCALLGFLPYAVMLLTPFDDRPRFRAPGSAILAVLAVPVQVWLTLSAGTGQFGSERLVLLVSAGLLLAVYLLSVRPGVGDGLFTLFAVMCQKFLIDAAAETFTQLLFPAASVRSYSWADALAAAVLQLAILGPCMFHWIKWYVPTLRANSRNPVWRFVWTAPAVSAAVQLALLSFGASAAIRAGVGTGLNLIAWPVCHAAFRRMHIRRVSTPLFASKAPETEPAPTPVRKSGKPLVGSAAQLETLQYRDLQQRITEANCTEQELLRHIDALSGHLDDRDYDKLRAHLDALRVEFSESEEPICANSHLADILGYFARQASHAGVKLTANIAPDADVPIDGQDLSLLLGNLLDNALDACKRQEGARWIHAEVYSEDGVVTVSVENSRALPIVRDKQGNILSTRHPGFGTGIPACREIAERWNGTLEIYEQKGSFLAVATLKL